MEKVFNTSVITSDLADRIKYNMLVPCQVILTVIQNYIKPILLFTVNVFLRKVGVAWPRIAKGCYVISMMTRSNC